MDFRHIRLDEPATGVVRVTLDRHPVNAVNMELYQEITAVFESFRTSNYKVVVLTGSGKTFCAGNDVNEFVAMSPETAEHHMAVARQAFWALYDCDIPVIAVVNGPALGTGFALAASCDFIIAGESATFGLPEMNVGVLGGAKFGVRVLPELVMRRLFFTGEPMSASEFARFGAVLDVVADDVLMERALQFVEKVGSKSGVALRMAKQALNAVEPLDLKNGYRIEQTFTVRMAGHPDSKEAARSMLEKRIPKFGRSKVTEEAS